LKGALGGADDDLWFEAGPARMRLINQVNLFKEEAPATGIGIVRSLLLEQATIVC